MGVHSSRFAHVCPHAAAHPALIAFVMGVLHWSPCMQVEAGSFTDSEILVMLGENGTGKTTFIRMLAGMLKPGAGFACRSSRWRLWLPRPGD